ncbi:hypothetical protein APZ41_005175 [Roseomonas mucosa]|uniref:Uncharacterized protein n=1 Tax=Roseomonas mucosa TaxID=207340 RepID=A0A1S8D8I4_9PROT|nr:hypothetical protein [Roseomonas mucosa]ONH84209.1 hypothetical protein APZ41_005175 [Roseomonas mucosa]
MTASPASARTLAAREALEEALVRLRIGKPTNPKLAELAVRGKLKVTVTTVAAEAGVSRTLVGVENCRFPDIRRRILEGDDGKEQRPVKGVSAVVRQLRADNAELRRQVQVLRSQQAITLARMLEAERIAQLARDDLARTRKGPEGDPKTGLVFPMPVRARPPYGRTRKKT